MRRLGELLQELGRITAAQLRRALVGQQAAGGRLGTALLEIGAISEEILLKALSQQFGVPFATAADLSDVSERVRQLLPAEVAIRYQVVPFRLVGNRVDLAMLEVSDLTRQDELAFFLGRGVNVHIAAEARILQALHRYYAYPASPRVHRLLRRLDRSPPTLPDSPALVEVAPPAAAQARPAPAVAPLESELLAPEAEPVAPPPALLTPPTSEPRAAPVPATLLLSEADRAYLGAPLERARAVEAVPAQAEASFHDTVARLHRAASAEEIADLLLDYLGDLFARVLLLRVRRHQVAGWRGRADGADLPGLASWALDLGEPSVFFNLSRGGRFFLGPLPPMRAHETVLEALGPPPPAECLVVPLRVAGRLALFLYGDRGAASLRGIDLQRLQRLAAAAALALQSCVLRRKRG